MQKFPLSDFTIRLIILASDYYQKLNLERINYQGIKLLDRNRNFIPK